VKKIHIDELKVGMIPVKTDKNWLTLHYMDKPIPDEESIEIIKKCNIKYLFIKEKQEFTGFSSNNLEKNSIEFNIDESDISKFTVSLLELQEAKLMYEKAKLITKDLFENIKYGKSVNIKPMQELVKNISTKFFKKPQVLTSMTRLKNFDEYTLVHSVNVSILCIALGKKLGFDGEKMQQLGIGGLLHDIGKIKLPDYIVNKKGPLTKEEYEIAKKHPEYGYEIIENDENISQTVKDIVLQHHERFDGSGYPFGLKEYQISQCGQIAAIVDVYDAMTSDRVYNKRKVHIEAIKIIHKLSGSHFSKAFVKFFIDVIGIYPVGTLVLLDTEELAVVFEKNDSEPASPKVIIITDEVLNGIVRKELTELVVQLGSKSLVVRNNQSRPLKPINNRSHYKGLSGPGHTKEYLMLVCGTYVP
jgi:putative nucleotidyltransferase with HDIG domain